MQSTLNELLEQLKFGAAPKVEYKIISIQEH